MPDVALPDSPAGRRLTEFLDGVRAGTLDAAAVEERVAEPFRKAVPAEQLVAMAKQLRPQLDGTVLDWVDGGSWDTALAVELVRPDGSGFAIDIKVESEPPHRISGMQFRALDSTRASLGPVAALPARDVVARADDGFDETLAAGLAAELERYVATGQVGVAAAVVVGGSATWTGEAGLASIETATRVRPDTIFRAYSISKTVTAAVLLALGLDLDDPVDAHLTSFRLVPPDGGPQPTLRQVLSHTAGVSSNFNHWVEHVVPVAEQLGSEWPCDTAAGTAWAYSNGGFATLGQVVEDVTGEPFEAAAARLVLEPLGMADSEFRRTNAVGDRWAVGYSVRRGEVAPADATVPSVLGAGSLFTTAADLTRFAASVAGGDDGAGLFRPQAGEVQPGQGLAWRLLEVDGRTWGAHGGGGHGFSTMLAVLPGTASGIVVLTNIGGQALAAVTESMQRLVQAHVG